LHQGQDCHELKREHFVKLAWLKWLFLHQLKFWVRTAFLIAAHFPLLHLHQGRDCHELNGQHLIWP
jgi:hypothetical protein